MDFYDLAFDDIPYWCAACKVSGVVNNNVLKIARNFKELKEKVVHCSGASIIVISVNEREIEVIEMLRRLGFKKGITGKNWGRGGRKTFMMQYQISRKEWVDFGGESTF
jgi:hypothetical protein